MEKWEKNLHCENIYNPGDPEIAAEQVKWQEKMYDYNHTRPSEGEKRTQLLKEMFAEIGEGCYIEPPFYANWAGKFMHFGEGVYANFYVGSHTMFGPNVTLATANHPMIPELRCKGYQYNLPIRIGENCWIGSGVVIVPGVTIGDNSVIGAGFF